MKAKVETTRSGGRTKIAEGNFRGKYLLKFPLDETCARKCPSKNYEALLEFRKDKLQKMFLEQGNELGKEFAKTKEERYRQAIGCHRCKEYIAYNQQLELARSLKQQYGGELPEFAKDTAKNVGIRLEDIE